MDVLQVGKYYYPELGGIETVAKTLSEGLVRGGNRVTVICASRDSSAWQGTINGVQVQKVPSYGTALSQPLTPSLPALLSKASSQHQLVQIHTPNPLMEVSASWLPKRVPLLATYHSDVIRQGWLKPFYYPALRRFLSRSDAIAVSSPQLIEHSDILGEFRDKCRVIPFGIDLESYKATPEVESRAAELRARHGEFLLFIGRLVPYKGAEFLIRAIQGTSRRAVLVGDGPLRSQLDSLCSELGVRDQVTLVGAVPDSRELLAYLHACRFFVLPSNSRAEAFGMVLLEAMACGKALISTRIPSGVRYVNSDGECGLEVAPGIEGVAELRAAIERLFSDQVLRAKLEEGAMSRVRTRFSSRSMINGYLELYRELVVS